MRQTNKYGKRGCADPQPAKLKGAREKNKYGELGRSDPQPPNLGGTSKPFQLPISLTYGACSPALGGENGPDYAPEKVYNRRSRMGSNSSALG